MTETMGPARSARPTPQPSGSWTWPGSAGLWIVILMVLVVIGFASGYVLGWKSGLDQNNKQKADLQTLTDKNQKLTAANDDLTKTIDDLKNQLQTAKDQLRDVFLAYKTMVIKSNQSNRISSADFSVGLAGPPSTDRVNININGKPHSAAAADTIDVGTISATCHVHVDSIDTFKGEASITTSCVPASP